MPIKQQGTAIVVALFVLALIAAASIAMIERLQLTMRRTELLLNDEQANLAAQGSVAWALTVLSQNLKEKQPNKIIDPTPIETTTQVNHIRIKNSLYDAEGYFNINNVIEKEYQLGLIKLLQTVVPTMTGEQAKAITDAVIDWLSPAINTPFDRYYSTLTPGYHSAHMSMSSPSELRLIKGVTPAIFQAVIPYLIALPEVTPININHASIPVLMTLSPTMTAETATQVAKVSKQTPFSSIALFRDLDVMKHHTISEKMMTVESHYFLLKTQVMIGDQQRTFYTLLRRSIKHSQPEINVVWQSKETF